MRIKQKKFDCIRFDYSIYHVPIFAPLILIMNVSTLFVLNILFIPCLFIEHGLVENLKLDCVKIHLSRL